MNDGINKMAENTAGYPFNFQVSVNNMQRYTMHFVGQVKLKRKGETKRGQVSSNGELSKGSVTVD